MNTAANGTVASSYGYEYDEAGNVTKEVAVQDGGTTTRDFAYTARGLLATVRQTGAAGGANWQYRYDAAGNRVWQQEVTSAGTRTAAYEYDPAGRLVKSNDSQDGETACTYDADGNLTAQTGTAGSFRCGHTGGSSPKAQKWLHGPME